MFYAPHILLRKKVSQVSRDEFGRVKATNESENWETLCRCRCDDNTTTEFTSDNGSVYRPNHHIVCSGNIAIKAGDIIRCIVGNDIIAEGEVYMSKQTNFLNYIEVWV